MLKTMSISRREALVAGLAALTGAAVGLTGSRAEPVSQMSDSELLGALQNVFWTSAQAPNDKIFYVIAAPWCGVCKNFYGQLRGMDGFQARFMLTAPHTDEERKLIAYAILANGQKGLDALYSSRKAPEALGTEAARDFALDVNAAAETALMGSLKARLANGHYGYPVLLFKSRGKLNVIAGAPRDPSQLIALVESGAGSPHGVSGVTPFLANPPKAGRSSNSGVAVRKSVDVRVAPLEASPRLHVLDRGDALPVVGETPVDGRKWLVLQVFKQGRPYGYGLADEFGG